MSFKDKKGRIDKGFSAAAIRLYGTDNLTLRQVQAYANTPEKRDFLAQTMYIYYEGLYNLSSLRRYADAVGTITLNHREQA